MPASSKATTPVEQHLPAGDYAALERAYLALKSELTELRQQYQETMLKKQELDMNARKNEYIYSQLNKEKQELIMEKIDIRTAMEELKAAQEEVLYKNEQLEKAYREISDHQIASEQVTAELNAKNEQLILRGIEYRTALEELKATQEELIVSQKMSALGHVISNIAHEINTPIGAIYAASQNVTNSLPHLLAQFPTLFKEMPEVVRPLFFELVEQAKLGAAQNDSTRDERLHRKEVFEKLEEMGLHNADNLARSLVKIGQFENLPHYLPLLQDEFGERMVDACMAIGRLRANIETIALAVGKTQKSILALKSYTDDELTPQKVGVVEIAQTLDTVVSQYKALHRNGLEIVTNYAEKLPLITCYPDQLTQVWNHLLLNAMQAMPRGGTLSVSALPSEDERHILVAISDTGPGIPQNLQVKIFDAFFTTRPEGEGSGLGLYVCKKIVARHNGRIFLQTEPGSTTFTVELPLKAVSG